MVVILSSIHVIIKKKQFNELKKNNKRNLRCTNIFVVVSSILWVFSYENHKNFKVIF